MLRRMSHVMLFTINLERALTWYEEQLGFSRVFVAPGAYASLRHPDAGCRLDLHPSEAQGKDVGFGPMPFFEVLDLEAALARLSAAGARTTQPRREGSSPRFATVWDSEGNALGLTEPAARAAEAPSAPR